MPGPIGPLDPEFLEDRSPDPGTPHLKVREKDSDCGAHGAEDDLTEPRSARSDHPDGNTRAQPSFHPSQVVAKAGNPRLCYPVVMFPGEEASVSLSEHGPCQLTL